MANVCSFEMKIRGQRDAIISLLEQIRCYDVSISDEKETESGLLVDAYGECRYGVYPCMIDEENEKTLSQLSEELSLEVEIFGYDISEPEWIEHYYYKNGELLHKYNLPCVIFPGDLEDCDEDDMPDLSKYEFIEGPNLYSLLDEFMEPFEWDQDEEKMHVTYIMK